jgi:hypothetical protein
MYLGINLYGGPCQILEQLLANEGSTLLVGKDWSDMCCTKNILFHVNHIKYKMADQEPIFQTSLDKTLVVHLTKHLYMRVADFNIKAVDSYEHATRRQTTTRTAPLTFLS